MTKYDWYGTDGDNKKIRRDAADAFLSDLLDGTITGVTGVDPAQKKKAHDEFNKKVRAAVEAAGQKGDLPTKVEVICVAPDTTNRSDVVVFILYPKGAKIPKPHVGTTADLWEERWAAAWAPY